MTKDETETMNPIGGAVRLTRRAALGYAAAVLAMSTGVATRAAAQAPLQGEMTRLKLHPTPQMLEDARFADATGASIPLSSSMGRWRLVNLWATWCPPCVREMPSLNRLAALSDQTGWTVLALSSDRQGDVKVPEFFLRYGLTALQVHLDPMGKAMRAWGARGLPTTLLVDPMGWEVARFEGAAEWDSTAALQALAWVRSRRGASSTAG